MLDALSLVTFCSFQPISGSCPSLCLLRAGRSESPLDLPAFQVSWYCLTAEPTSLTIHPKLSFIHSYMLVSIHWNNMLTLRDYNVTDLASTGDVAMNKKTSSWVYGYYMQGLE